MQNQAQTYLGNPNVKRDGVATEWTKEDVQEYAKCMKDPAYFATNYAKIICVKGKNHIKSVADQDISIIATEKIDSITLDGLQYTMKNQILNPSARAICNKTIANEFYVESTGKVLVILNHIK